MMQDHLNIVYNCKKPDRVANSLFKHNPFKTSMLISRQYSEKE